jgi:hypothetical protein
MIDDTPETKPAAEKFDYSAFPQDTLFHDRRHGLERRSRVDDKADSPPTDANPEADEAGSAPPPAKERRAKKERRRRIDPTTFEKQYTEDELEFMNAMQQFKVQSCKSFPSHGDVLRVACLLGYRKLVPFDGGEFDFEDEPLDEAGGLEDHELNLRLSDDPAD